jgi:4-hydroxybenzoate polyprenyltransferase
MLWALLAAFLRRRPPWLQAGMVGLCTGIFVVANVNAGQRDLRPAHAAALVLAAAVPIGWAFSRALRAELRSRAAGRPTTSRVHAAYAAVWLISVTAAVGTIVGDGGVKVAVIAIVPIVLLAPPAVIGIRALLGRRTERDRAVPPIAC